MDWKMLCIAISKVGWALDPYPSLMKILRSNVTLIYGNILPSGPNSSEAEFLGTIA